MGAMCKSLGPCARVGALYAQDERLYAQDGTLYAQVRALSAQDAVPSTQEILPSAQAPPRTHSPQQNENTIPPQKGNGVYLNRYSIYSLFTIIVICPYSTEKING